MGEPNNAWKIAGIVNGAVALCIVAAFFYTRDDSEVTERHVPLEEVSELPQTNQNVDLLPDTPGTPETRPERISEVSTFTFSGKVTDDRNRRMSGVSVGLTGKAGRFTLTDEKGYFEFTEIKKGRYKVQLKKLHWGEHTESLKISSNLKKDFKFLHHVTIRGNVVEGSTDRAVERFNLGVHDGNDNQLSIGKKDRLNILNAEGLFELRLPQDTRMEYVSFSAYGYKPKNIPISELTPGATNRIELQPSERSHEGVVLSPAGVPLSEAYVYGSSLATGDNAHMRANAVTDQDGRFRFDSLSTDPDEPVTLFANHEGFAPAMFNALISEISANPVEITLGYAGALHVETTAGETKLRDVDIELIYPGTIVFGEWDGATNTEGIAAFSGLPSGQLYVLAELPLPVNPEFNGLVAGGGSAQPTTKYKAKVEIQSGETSYIRIDREARTAALEGYVTWQGRRTTDQGEIQIAVQNDFGDEYFSTKLDDEGYYVFDKVPPGTAKVVYYHEGGDAHDAVTIRSFDTELFDGATTRFDLELFEGNSHITIRASGWDDGEGILLVYAGHKDPNENPASGLYDFLLETLDPDVRFASEIGEKDRLPFSIPDLPPGDYTVCMFRIRDWFVVNNKDPFIFDTITLTENEEKVLEYLLE
jgi:hypothetical protein